MTTRLHKAVQFATDAHFGQDRDGGLPYIIHPLQVMRTVSLVEHDEDMLIAAVLHDVVEDTMTPLQNIVDNFGLNVGDMVDQLTDKAVIGNRETRIAAHTKRLEGASPSVQTIKLADIIDNVRTIGKAKPDFAQQYVQEKLAQYDVLTKASPAMRMRAAEALANALHSTI